MKCSSKLSERIRKNFRFSTLSFLFIIAYVNIFQILFGPVHSIVGVIFTIMMSASMVRDLTAAPFKHFILQALVLVWMAVAAYLVTACPAPLSFLINFATLLMILYAFTYEYASHMYFPYILSYLFLVFFFFFTASQLPKRILGMLVGAVSIMLYQWIMGRKRVAETARDVLSEMIEDIRSTISSNTENLTHEPDLPGMRSKLCRLSQTVYERRKKAFCISDSSYSMVAAGRGLEQLAILIHELSSSPSPQNKEFLHCIDIQLSQFHAFILQERAEIPALDPSVLAALTDEKTARVFNNILLYIRDRLLHMTDPQGRVHFRKSALSFKIRLQSAIDLSPVRAIYALRTALLLSLAVLAVQYLPLPHGRWLLFTLASVSLPYADDVPQKIKNRIFATILGGLISVAIYSLISSPAGRTAAMMLSGYLSFYFTDYKETFACSTVGALGGAVFMNAFGFQAVGGIFLIRLGYILAGAAIGYIINCLLFPYHRAKATSQLWEKYKAITELLTKVCRADQIDPQLYYHLVIQAHMQEEKLIQNASLEKWKEFPAYLAKYQEELRIAHRKLIAERADAPPFESGHVLLKTVP